MDNEKNKKKVLNVKRRFFDEYCRINEHTKIQNKFKCLQNKLSFLIEDFKEKYQNDFFNKLSASNNSSKNSAVATGGTRGARPPQ